MGEAKSYDSGNEMRPIYMRQQNIEAVVDIEIRFSPHFSELLCLCVCVLGVHID